MNRFPQAVEPALTAQSNAARPAGNTLPECQRLLRLPDVLNIAGLGKTTIYSLIKNGVFPHPKKIGKASLWSGKEVIAWVTKIEGEQK